MLALRYANLRLSGLEQIVSHTSKEAGRSDDRWGPSLENTWLNQQYYAYLLRLFQERGIEVNRIFRRATRHRPDVQMEMDILAVNGNVVVAIEVKSRLAQNEVDRFGENLANVKQAFPEYAPCEIYGAIAP